jgi:D-alanyl-D-alanine dipeptidase
MYVCGSAVVDVEELKQHTVYDKYRPTDVTISIFWEVVRGFSDEDRTALIKFAWGRARLPRGDWFDHSTGENISFTISKHGERDALPEAHTCFFLVRRLWLECEGLQLVTGLPLT